MTSEVVAARRAIPADTFAVRLMIARQHAGNLTVKEAAARCGIVDQSWSNWEHGRLPHDKVEVAEAISEGLDVDFDWLLRGGPLGVPAPSSRRRRIRTSAYGPTRHVVMDRPQSPVSRPPTYGANRRSADARPGAIQRRKVAAT